MNRRAVWAAVAALCLVGATLPTTPANAPIANYWQVKQVICDDARGTAFLTDHGWISVAHVTTHPGCEIDGHPITGQGEGKLDFARVTVALPSLRGLKVNCDGFIPGHYYFAAGYAGGFEWQTMVRLLATYKMADNGFRVLIGSPTVIPGMSGGPLMNEAGEVVGLVNAYNTVLPVSFSRELKDTSVCRHS